MNASLSTHPLRHWFLAAALLGGCTAEEPEPDPVPTATVTGVVEIDSAIQGATVFADFNDNNLLDAGEPQTTTDATGHFTLTWDNPGPVYAPTIGAIVAPTSTRVGVTGDASVGFALHMRAPLGDTSGDFTGTTVISPLTTLVTSEMAYDPSLTQAAAVTKLSTALTSSQLPFSGQPLNLMSDYAADYTATTATAADSAQLRYTASAVASVVSSAVAKGNSLQSYVDCDDVTFFTPAIVALDKQLTAIANGTFKFSQLTRTQQNDVAQNPNNYPSYFVDTTQLANDIDSELLAAGEQLAAALFEEFEDEFAQEMTEVVADLALELVEIGIEALVG